MEQQLYFTIDSDELVSLRDFGYLLDDEFENKEAITNALHTVISDLWKMKMSKPTHRSSEVFGYKANEITETIVIQEDMMVGDSVLFINNEWTDFLDIHLYRIKDITGRMAVLEKENAFINKNSKQYLLDKLK